MSYNFQQPFMTLGNGLNTMQGGTVGGWKELGRTTLGSAANTLTVSSLADKRYYKVLFYNPETSTRRPLGRLNGDTGSNYAHRNTANGSADSTAASQTHFFVKAGSGSAGGHFSVMYFSNLSSQEKLGIIHTTNAGTAGAANSPDRREIVMKHAQTSNPINSITVYDETSSNFAIGTEIVVLGWDPADTHTANFWEELASDSPTSGDTLTSGTITAKKYLWVQVMVVPTGGTANAPMNFNSDTGSNYNRRESYNGGADATYTSQTLMWHYPFTESTPSFYNMFIINNSANEKLTIAHGMGQGTAGAGSIGNRSEEVNKWTNTASQITNITCTNSGTGDYGAGTIMKVWGSD